MLHLRQQQLWRTAALGLPFGPAQFSARPFSTRTAPLLAAARTPFETSPPKKKAPKKEGRLARAVLEGYDEGQSWAAWADHPTWNAATYGGLALATSGYAVALSGAVPALAGAAVTSGGLALLVASPAPLFRLPAVASAATMVALVGGTVAVAPLPFGITVAGAGVLTLAAVALRQPLVWTLLDCLSTLLFFGGAIGFVTFALAGPMVIGKKKK